VPPYAAGTFADRARTDRIPASDSGPICILDFRRSGRITAHAEMSAVPMGAYMHSDA